MILIAVCLRWCLQGQGVVWFGGTIVNYVASSSTGRGAIQGLGHLTKLSGRDGKLLYHCAQTLKSMRTYSGNSGDPIRKGEHAWVSVSTTD